MFIGALFVVDETVNNMSISRWSMSKSIHPFNTVSLNKMKKWTINVSYNVNEF